MPRKIQGRHRESKATIHWMAVRPCWILVTACLLVVACRKEEGPRKQEDLTIVVEADRSQLAEAEQRLKFQVDELSRERKDLDTEKNSLRQSRDSLQDKDEFQERRLLLSEQRMIEREQAMQEREHKLIEERERLLQQRSALTPGAVEGGAVRVNPVSAEERQSEVTGRERALAQREGDLARREEGMTTRETELARREGEFLKLQAGLLSGTDAGRNRQDTAKASRAEVEKVYRDLGRRMQEKGVLWSDLSDRRDAWRQEIEASMRKQEWWKAQAGLDAALSSLQAVRLDADFVDRKLQALSRLARAKPPSPVVKETLSASLRKVTQWVGDGRYDQANSELNRLFGLIGR